MRPSLVLGERLRVSSWIPETADSDSGRKRLALVASCAIAVHTRWGLGTGRAPPDLFTAS